MRVRYRLAAIVVGASLVAVTPAAVLAQSTTGLDRAREATAKGLEQARGMSDEGQAKRARGLDPDRARGLDRAAEAIERARDRASERAKAKDENRGRGNALGRGHAEEVHGVLAGGGSPSELAGVHGKKVRELVRTYNELKKAGD